MLRTLRNFKGFQDLAANTYIDNHAVVVGSSIAGMLSARVLADHFASVSIIEKDKLPDQPDARKGVPQSFQPHTLLVKGYELLEDFFPGIRAKLLTSGALEFDWGREFHLFEKVGWMANTKTPSDVVSITCSRPLIEWVVRQELSKFTNIRFIEGHRVTGLLFEPNNKQVKGVHLYSIVSSTENTLPADLVVNTAGRSSNASHWLENIGFPAPPETVVDPFLGYATRRYREPKDWKPNWKVMLISQSPPNCTRLGYLARIEDGEWIATLGGYGHDFPPIDNDGFLEFARSLRSLEFYQAIKDAEPTSPIYAHRATANRLLHYEKVNLPQGFVALGDAVCALCPIYGQGITVSALGAVVLRDWLNSSKKGLCVDNFQNSLAQINLPHWGLATTLDLGFSTTLMKSDIYSPVTQKRKPGKISQFLNWYIKQFLLNTTRDANLTLVWLKVVNLLKSPLSFFNPLIVIRVLCNPKKYVGKDI